MGSLLELRYEGKVFKTCSGYMPARTTALSLTFRQTRGGLGTRCEQRCSEVLEGQCLGHDAWIARRSTCATTQDKEHIWCMPMSSGHGFRLLRAAVAGQKAAAA
eukprot:3947755-Amphidinium_carterae.1